MKYCFVALLLGCSPTLFSQEKALDISHALKTLTCATPVRVLLKEGTTQDLSCSLGCETGSILYAPQSHTAVVCHESTLKIMHKEGAFFCNKQRYAEPILFILPLKGLLTSDSIPYDGFFCVSTVDDSVYLVNHLDLEHYLESVLPYESIPCWPDEVHKALCIACRTYGLAQIARQRKRKDPLPYDLRCTVSDQVYRGYQRKSRLKKVVQETKGMVLTQKNKPILAMYSSVCGGVIPAHKERFDFSHMPYLKRDYPCTHCSKHRYHSWKSSYHFTELEPLLKKHLPGFDALHAIKVGDYDQAGVAHTVWVKDSSETWYSLASTKFRELFERVLSVCCTFTTEGKTLNIQGNGKGHHMGLCQWGAYYMVKKGHSYKEVLKFYYPGTTLMKFDGG